MVDIQSGLIGLSVAGHVIEELNIVIVHARVPRLQTEEEIAVDWDKLKSHRHVKNIGAQVEGLYRLERNKCYTCTGYATYSSGILRVTCNFRCSHVI